ncbi:MAG: OmpA family protein [Alphaproteobacteria bacterium]|nr:OmpA family protein [Alphaproteobacteria bacterium]
MTPTIVLRGRRAPLLSGALAAGLALAAVPATAQVVISSQTRTTGVSVNQDVLDALGPPRSAQIIDPNTTTRSRGPTRAGDVPRSRLYGAAALPRSGLVDAPRSALAQTAPVPAMPVRDPQGALHLTPLSQPSGDPQLNQQMPTMTAAPTMPAPTQPRSGLAPSVASAAPSYVPPSPAPRSAGRSPQASPPPAVPALDPVPLPRTPPQVAVSTPSTPVAPPPPRPAPLTSTDSGPPIQNVPSPPPSAPITPGPMPTPMASAPPPAAPMPMPAAAPPAPAPTPAPRPMASAPPGSPLPAPVQTAAAGALSRVLFTNGSADLDETARRELAQLAGRLGRDGESRIQLLAYADGSAENESQARRLSLSRALAVRSYLIEQGIRSTRVNVQALGIKSAGGPADRVDAMAATP